MFYRAPKVWLFKVKRYPWAVSYGNKYLDRTIEWTRSLLRSRQVPIPSPQNSDSESGKSALVFVLKVNWNNSSSNLPNGTFQFFSEFPFPKSQRVVNEKSQKWILVLYFNYQCLSNNETWILGSTKFEDFSRNFKLNYPCYLVFMFEMFTQGCSLGIVIISWLVFRICKFYIFFEIDHRLSFSFFFFSAQKNFNFTFNLNFFSGIDELGLAYPDLCRHLFLHLQLQLKQKRPAQAERPARYFSDEVESDSANQQELKTLFISASKIRNRIEFQI